MFSQFTSATWFWTEVYLLGFITFSLWPPLETLRQNQTVNVLWKPKLRAKRLKSCWADDPSLKLHISHHTESVESMVIKSWDGCKRKDVCVLCVCLAVFVCVCVCVTWWMSRSSVRSNLCVSEGGLVHSSHVSLLTYYSIDNISLSLSAAQNTPSLFFSFSHLLFTSCSLVLPPSLSVLKLV